MFCWSVIQELHLIVCGYARPAAASLSIWHLQLIRQHRQPWLNAGYWYTAVGYELSGFCYLACHLWAASHNSCARVLRKSIVCHMVLAFTQRRQMDSDMVIYRILTAWVRAIRPILLHKVIHVIQDDFKVIVWAGAIQPSHRFSILLVISVLLLV